MGKQAIYIFFFTSVFSLNEVVTVFKERALLLGIRKIVYLADLEEAVPFVNCFL